MKNLILILAILFSGFTALTAQNIYCEELIEFETKYYNLDDTILVQGVSYKKPIMGEKTIKVLIKEGCTEEYVNEKNEKCTRIVKDEYRSYKIPFIVAWEDVSIIKPNTISFTSQMIESCGIVATGIKLDCKD